MKKKKKNNGSSIIMTNSIKTKLEMPYFYNKKKRIVQDIQMIGSIGNTN